MTLNLTGLEIRDRFGSDSQKLSLLFHRMEFATELEQENGAKVYHKNEWKVIEAGQTQDGNYFFKAAKPWPKSPQ